MKTVLVRGPLLSKSGYGEHSRQVLRYLLEKPGLKVETQVLPWGITPWKIDPEDPDVKSILSRTSNMDRKYDLSFQIQLPNEWDPSLAIKNIGVTASVETDICNPEWTLTHTNKMDKVIVPSVHAKKNLGGNSVSSIKNISVVPESFFDEINEDCDPIDLDLKSDFNFLTVGILTGKDPFSDRKNLFYLIKWFVEEFKNDPDVGLVIKTSQGRDSQIDRVSTKQLLRAVLNEVGHRGSPKIYFLHGSMSRKDMVGLYKNKKIKAFLSATRGEGFGLPHLEAAACGLPVIATDWSAHKEFLDLGKWIKIKYRLEPVHSNRIDDAIFIKGSKWAEVDEVDFKKKIRKFKTSSEIPQKNADALMPIILENYSWSSIRKKYDQALSGLLD